MACKGSKHLSHQRSVAYAAGVAGTAVVDWRSAILPMVRGRPLDATMPRSRSLADHHAAVMISRADQICPEYVSCTISIKGSGFGGSENLQSSADAGETATIHAYPVQALRPPHTSSICPPLWVKGWWEGTVSPSCLHPGLKKSKIVRAL